jgi:MFS family permease
MSPELNDKESKDGFLVRLANRLPIFKPLLRRDFRLLWIGESISLIGDHIHFIALSWLTLQITGSGLALGTVLMVGAIPRALLMLLGGALSDRLSPRKIMIASNIVRGILVATIAFIIYNDVIELWHLYVLSITFGIADAFFHPAFNAIIPRIVDKDKLEAGNAILQGSHELSFFIAAAPAGLLISAIGIHFAFGIDAISFVIATVVLFLMSETRKADVFSDNVGFEEGKPRGIKGILKDIKKGLVYAWNKPAFRAMLLAIAVIDFCFAGPIDIGIAWLADNRYIGGASAFGIVLSAIGGGAVIGIIIAGSVKFKKRGILLALIGAVSGIGLALYGVLPDVLSASILSFVMGIGVGIFNILLISWLQKESPPNMIGRVMSLMTFASLGLMPISFAVAGVLVDINVPIMFAAAGGIVLITSIYLLTIRAFREIR